MVLLTPPEIRSTLAYYERTSRRSIYTSLETIEEPSHHAAIERRTQHPLTVACESIQSGCDGLDQDRIRQYLDALINITAFMIQRTNGCFEHNPLHDLVQRTIKMLEAKVWECWDEGYASSY